MGQRVYRPYDPEQAIATPDDLRTWLPADHMVYLVSDIVASLDLSRIVSSYEQGDGRGYPAYHPVMMTKLLIYAYCQGVTSSREIARKTYEDVAFRIVTADQHPDFRTISDFRERHLGALGGLFVQVVQLAQRLDLVRLEHVAQDGSKILANASKHKAMSYERMKAAEARLNAEIARILEAAASADQAEDALYGAQQSGETLPEALATELQRREQRLAVIQVAKAALEAEARAEADAIRAADAAERAQREQAGQPKKPGRPPDPSAEPKPTAQRNFTDPDSRIMKNSDKAFVQAYNGQITVDATAQIIVGQTLTNQAADGPHLPSMVTQVETTTGQQPKRWSADAGYWSADNVAHLQEAGIDAYIAPVREKHVSSDAPSPYLAAALGQDPAPPTWPTLEPADLTTTAGMRAKLSTPAGKATYALRKSIVEPVFGQTKQARGLRRFRLRGLPKVEAEWTLWCLTHNVLKISRAMRAAPDLRARLTPFQSLCNQLIHVLKALQASLGASVPPAIARTDHFAPFLASPALTQTSS